jgi:hypothetical protein
LECAMRTAQINVNLARNFRPGPVAQMDRAAVS